MPLWKQWALNSGLAVADGFGSLTGKVSPKEPSYTCVLNRSSRGRISCLCVHLDGFKGQRQSSLGMYWVLFLSFPFGIPLSELVGSRNPPNDYLYKLPNKMPGRLMERICIDLWPWSLVITKQPLEWEYCTSLLSTGSCQWRTRL